MTEGRTNMNTELMQALLDSPPAKALAAARVKAIAAERHRNAAELERERSGAAKDFHAHAAALAIGMDKVHRLEADLRAGRSALGKLLHDRGVASWQTDRRLTALENELRETADPAIDLFIEEIADLAGATRKAMPILDGREIITNMNTGAKKIVSNPVITARKRLEKIAEARAAAEGLKLEPDQSGVPDRLAALRAEIPSLGAPIHE
jgi:hypothetical protein